MTTPLERIKEFLLENPAVLGDGIGIDVTEIGERIAEGTISLFQDYEMEDLKETIGEIDYQRFVDEEEKEFKISEWLADHCYSEKAFCEWLGSLPEPDEDDLGKLSVGKGGMVYEDYPQGRKRPKGRE